MILPILACENPYDAAAKFVSAGWRLVLIIYNKEDFK